MISEFDGYMARKWRQLRSSLAYMLAVSDRDNLAARDGLLLALKTMDVFEEEGPVKAKERSS